MWSPRDFQAYRALYPHTPPLDLPDPALTDRFVAAWEGWSDTDLDARLAAHRHVEVGFVRGFLGNWMPGNLVAPAKALAALGFRSRVLKNHSGRTVVDNIARLERQLTGDGPLVLCGHSKGGLECLRLLDTRAHLARRAVGVVLSQTPRGPSAVLESLLLHSHEHSKGRKRWVEEWTQRVGLYAVGATPAGRQLTREPLASLIAEVDATQRPYPVWQTASWSSQPTTWLDSFHERLDEIRPGCAHDGQFYLEHLLWPGLPHVLLPHVDHAQPVVGGFDFPHVRYWKVVLALFLDNHGFVESR